MQFKNKQNWRSGYDIQVFQCRPNEHKISNYILDSTELGDSIQLQILVNKRICNNPSWVCMYMQSLKLKSGTCFFSL